MPNPARGFEKIDRRGVYDVPVRPVAPLLGLLALAWAGVASAQLRVAPFPTSVTASGHPMSAWVTVWNDADRPVRVEIRGARSLDGPPVALRVHGIEVDDVRVEGAFVVPPHASVRVVVFVSGFEGAPRQRYDVSLDVCEIAGACVEGRSHVGRAHRDPIRR
jgi:hypothetical protein